MATTAIMTSEKSQTYTIEEYFELEKHAEIRHEFVNGKLIPLHHFGCHLSMVDIYENVVFAENKSDD